MLVGATALSCTDTAEPSEPRDPPQVGAEREAAEWVRAWLTAAGGAAADRGWSLLHPATREQRYQGMQARYVADVERADWRRFAWAVEASRFHDGEYRVELAVGATDAIPRFLIEKGLIQLVPAGQGTQETVVVVELTPNREEGGVLAVR